VAVNQRVAIIGSGLIGRSWAVVFAGGGFDVALYDAASGVADQAHGLVSDALEELSAHGLVKDAKVAAARARGNKPVGFVGWCKLHPGELS
jgi:L-gulonate 3-dehydrogenase